MAVVDTIPFWMAPFAKINAGGAVAGNTTTSSIETFSSRNFGSLVDSVSSHCEKIIMEGQIHPWAILAATIIATIVVVVASTAFYMAQGVRVGDANVVVSKVLHEDDEVPPEARDDHSDDGSDAASRRPSFLSEQIEI